MEHPYVLNQFQFPNQLKLSMYQLDPLKLLLVVTNVHLALEHQETVLLVTKTEKTHQIVLVKTDFMSPVMIVLNVHGDVQMIVHPLKNVTNV